MSRSYKKHHFSSYVCYKSDKPFRQMYNRARRRKDKAVLWECENYFRNPKNLFKPYENVCPLHGEVCCVDEWCYERTDEWIVGDVSKEFPKPCNLCIGCYWSENNTNNEYVWWPDPDEKLINTTIDYTTRLSDKWGWPSDGGVFYQGGISLIRKDFEAEVFGYDHYGSKYENFPKTIWDKYQKAIKPTAYLSDWFWIDYFLKKGILPRTFKTAEELIGWYRKNEETLIKMWYKKDLRK